MVGEVTLYSAAVGIERPAHGSESVARGTGAPPSGGEPVKINESVNFSSPGVGRYAERLAQVDESNRAAKAVRAADVALGQVGDALTEIKHALTQIVKQYPPYGMASPERIAYLNSISGLRKQIEALAPYLAIDAGVAGHIPGTAAAGVAPLLLGGGDLPDIPDLGPGASDAEVAAALPGVDAALDRVGRVRTAMADAIRQATAASATEAGSLRFAFF